MCQAYSFSNEVKDLGNLLWKVNSSLLPRKAFFFQSKPCTNIPLDGLRTAQWTKLVETGTHSLSGWELSSRAIQSQHGRDRKPSLLVPDQ